MLAECLAGFAVGLAARYFVPDSPGAGVDTLLGLMGGGVAGFIYTLFGHRLSVEEFDAWSLIVAAGGAFSLIVLSRAASGRRTIAP
jgi:uncharacterized membrane protein YeaQ/YmgE (transglycosylase-associated protein family)